jgi:hypothetical protein
MSLKAEMGKLQSYEEQLAFFLLYNSMFVIVCYFLLLQLFIRAKGAPTDLGFYETYGTKV